MGLLHQQFHHCFCGMRAGEGKRGCSKDEAKKEKETTEKRTWEGRGREGVRGEENIIKEQGRNENKGTKVELRRIKGKRVKEAEGRVDD